MHVTIQTPNGERSFEFVNALALELFLESLPEGWVRLPAEGYATQA